MQETRQVRTLVRRKPKVSVTLSQEVYEALDRVLEEEAPVYADRSHLYEVALRDWLSRREAEKQPA